MGIYNIIDKLMKNDQKRREKRYFFVIFWPFFDIRYSAGSAEYSGPNIRLILAEYSAEYSVFGRTLIFKK